MNEAHENSATSKHESIWLRLVFIFLFAIVLNIAEFALWLTVLVQFISKAVTGKTMATMTSFGHNLATFVYDVIRFLTFRIDDMPWPFAPWPNGAPSAEGGGRRRRRTTGEAAETSGD